MRVSSSLALLAVLLVGSALTVFAAEGGGECRNTVGVFECPAYNYTQHTGYQYRVYHTFEVAAAGRTGRDIFRTAAEPELEVYEYLNGSNTKEEHLNHTLPFSIEVVHGLSTDEIAAFRFIPRKSVPAPAPTNRNVTLRSVPEDAFHAAVGEFFGDVTTELIYQHLERLERIVRAANHTFDERAFTFATYAPPEVRGTDRRNEIWLHIVPRNTTAAAAAATPRTVNKVADMVKSHRGRRN